MGLSIFDHRNNSFLSPADHSAIPYLMVGRDRSQGVNYRNTALDIEMWSTLR